MPAENIELLIEFTHDDDPRARAMAVAGLAKAADARGFAPVLVCLFDPVDEVRAAAATALGIFGDDRAFEALVECLNDPNERVAVNAPGRLARFPPRAASTSSARSSRIKQSRLPYASPPRRLSASAPSSQASTSRQTMPSSSRRVSRCSVLLVTRRASCVRRAFGRLDTFPRTKRPRSCASRHSTMTTSGSCDTPSRRSRISKTSQRSNHCSSSRSAMTTRFATSRVRLSTS